MPDSRMSWGDQEKQVAQVIGDACHRRGGDFPVVYYHCFPTVRPSAFKDLLEAWFAIL